MSNPEEHDARRRAFGRAASRCECAGVGCPVPTHQHTTDATSFAHGRCSAGVATSSGNTFAVLLHAYDDPNVADNWRILCRPCAEVKARYEVYERAGGICECDGTNCPAPVVHGTILDPKLGQRPTKCTISVASDDRRTLTTPDTFFDPENSTESAITRVLCGPCAGRTAAPFENRDLGQL